MPPVAGCIVPMPPVVGAIVLVGAMPPEAGAIVPAAIAVVANRTLPKASAASVKVFMSCPRFNGIAGRLPPRVSGSPGTLWAARSWLVRGKDGAALRLLDQHRGPQTCRCRRNRIGRGSAGPRAQARQFAYDVLVRQRHAFVLAARDGDVDGARIVADQPDIGGALRRRGGNGDDIAVQRDRRTGEMRGGDEMFDVALPVADRVSGTIDDDLRRERPAMAEAGFIRDLPRSELRLGE